MSTSLESILKSSNSPILDFEQSLHEYTEEEYEKMILICESEIKSRYATALQIMRLVLEKSNSTRIANQIVDTLCRCKFSRRISFCVLLLRDVCNYIMPKSNCIEKVDHLIERGVFCERDQFAFILSFARNDPAQIDIFLRSKQYKTKPNEGMHDFLSLILFCVQSGTSEQVKRIYRDHCLSVVLQVENNGWFVHNIVKRFSEHRLSELMRTQDVYDVLESVSEEDIFCSKVKEIVYDHPEVVEGMPKAD